MKRIFVLVGVLIFSACSKNDPENRCNYLLNVGVDVMVNLNLPQYSQLEFPGNTVYIGGYGNAGIYLSNSGNQFRAFDAADPNHAPSSCSLLVQDGGVGTCGCEDENQYSLATGLPFNTDVQCVMKEYRVESAGGNLLHIYN
ncbi:MAG TPA: hypothetical protein VKZ98_07480 [Aquaticitalea sp.]|nr:hypothetical protein [Aquaticitalea sp.]